MYCVINLHWRVGEFLELPPRKQAALIAYVKTEIETAKEQRKSLKSSKVKVGGH